jgi:3-hydroxyisobutyrate dehydrogenase-like beta-hydroxyacid dehydrogenase
MAQIAILHPGEMGAGVGAELVAIGHDVSWRPGGRSATTRERAERAGLTARSDITGCDAVISLCPPAAALATAESIGSFTGLYIDANAISPDTAAIVAQTVRARGADYVDAAVIGLAPQHPGITRMYFSGPRAAAAAQLFAATSIATVVLDRSEYAASALKMVYAAWSKISGALALSARASAQALGVEAALMQEWSLSQPGMTERLERALESARTKGWRWEEEMRQIAQTFAGVGQPDGFGLAAAEVFSRYERPDGTGQVGQAG